MRAIEFWLKHDWLEQGVPTKNGLIVRNTLSEPIYNLTFDVHTSQNIQMLGKKRLKCDYLETGETATFHLVLIGVSPTNGEICIDEVVGRVHGKREELSPVILPLLIRETEMVCHNAIRVLHNPPRLKENGREILKFELHNHSPLNMEQVEISISGQDWAFRGDETSLFIPSVKSGETCIFPVHIKPMQAGRIELNLHLSGITVSQPYQKSFTFEYQVDPDHRPRIQHTEVKTGDIMNLRGVLSLTGDALDNSPQPSGRHSGLVFQTEGIKFSENNDRNRCPSCGEMTSGRHYCNNCGKPLCSK